MKSPSTPPTSAIRDEKEKAYSSFIEIYPGFALYNRFFLYMEPNAIKNQQKARNVPSKGLLHKRSGVACSNQPEDSFDRSGPMRAKPGYISLGQGDTAAAEHDLQLQRVPGVLNIQGIVRQLS